VWENLPLSVGVKYNIVSKRALDIDNAIIKKYVKIYLITDKVYISC
jgi:hypothetical protein